MSRVKISGGRTFSLPLVIFNALLEYVVMVDGLHHQVCQSEMASFKRDVLSEIGFECILEDCRFAGFEIDRYDIKTHIPILDFSFFNVDKGGAEEFSLLPMCYGFFGKAVFIRGSSLDFDEGLTITPS